MKRQQILNPGIPILIGVALLVYVILRAALIPITHDEANTCLTFSIKSVWDIITYTDPIPNNHILNTLLIKLFTGIFGMHAFIARLPNILGFILYYSILVIWLRKLSSNFIFVLTGIILFTCNPYLMDFFSLARGYALSISFMITSCFFSWKYFQSKNSRDHLFALLFAAIAVYTNFTTLNFFIALILLIFIADLRQYFKADRKLFYRRFAQITIITLILGFLSFYPIYRMVSTGQFVFWGTKGFYSDTLITLVQASTYGKNYFNLKANSFVNIYLYFIFLISVFAFIQIRQNKFKLNKDPFPFFVLLLIAAVATNILQYYIMRTPYLTTRTALFYYPLSMVAVLFFLKFLSENFKRGYRLFSGAFIFAGLIHMSGTVNLESSYEWWYDKNTFDVLSKLEAENNPDSIITLDAGWLFYPSLNFHIVTDNHDKISLQDFHTNIDSNSISDYYYIVSSDYEELKKNYVIDTTYEYGTRILLKKKIN